MSTGVAGTLRPSKLEALLGSERVGLDRDGQAQARALVRDWTLSRISCRRRLTLPCPAPGERRQGSPAHLVGLATEFRRLFRSP